MFDYLLNSLKEIEKYGNYPQIDTIDTALGPRIKVGNIEYILFSSNSYLGLSTNERCKTAAIDAIKKYGTGSGASRIVSGTFKLHNELESSIADFKKKDSAMVLTSGYSTNISLIPVLINGFSIFQKNDADVEKVIFSDEYNHASLIDGMRLSKAKIEVYQHNNMTALEKLIANYPNARKLIVTDSVFSMDGDIVRLDELVKIKRKYNCNLLIDEAHATGVIGDHGRGVADYFGVTDDVDVIMGTFSKALGSIGGYVVGDTDLIKILKVAVRGYVFSTALPPADLAVSIEALNILNGHPNLGKELLEKSRLLREQIQSMGFSTLNSETQIIPILIGDPLKALLFQKALRERKIIAPCIQWPAVPKEMSRIRLSLMATHSDEDINYLVEVLKEIKTKIGI